jgi:membrane protease YdiL (CAAX protease family)
MKKFIEKNTNAIILSIIYVIIFVQYPLGVGISQLILHKDINTAMQPEYLILWGVVRLVFVLPLIFILMQRLSWDNNDIFMRLGDYKKVVAITFWSTFAFMILGLAVYPWFLHSTSLTPILFLEYAPIFLIYAISNAFVEETFFRGLAQNFFSRKLPIVIAILTQAIFFSLIHIYSPMSSNVSLFVFITFILGLLWGYLTNKYRSLVPAIVLHVVADIFVAISLF